MVLMKNEVQQAAASKLIGQAQARAVKQASAANLKKEVDALAAQRVAEREARGFWSKLKKFAGTVAKVAAVVAAVAGSVFSGGSTLVAAAAIVAVGLSGGATVVRETRMFGDLTDNIALGMEIGSAVIGIAGCGVGILQAEKAAEHTATWARVTTAAAQLTGGAATATSATARVVIAGHQHDADQSAADAADARGRMEIQVRETQMILEWLERVSEQESEATDTTVRTLEGCSRATEVAIAGVRG